MRHTMYSVIKIYVASWRKKGLKRLDENNNKIKYMPHGLSYTVLMLLVCVMWPLRQRASTSIPPVPMLLVGFVVSAPGTDTATTYTVTDGGKGPNCGALQKHH
jgi:hypothetical protein